MQDTFDHCEQLLRSGDKDRYLATLFIPQKYRRALFALYAFNLEVAKTREMVREPLAGEIRLQWWRDAISGAGQAEAAAHPVAAALRDVVVRYRLPLRELVDLVDARAFDLYNEPMASIDQLERYAAQTSSSLLGLAGRILYDGRDPKIDDVVHHGGVSLALAGLLRALPVHSARGQLYLPADLMQRYGAAPEDVLGGNATTEVCAVLADVRLLARRHLRALQERLDSVPDLVLPALLPLALVRPVLDRMERNSAPFASRDLPQWRRQWVLWRAARTSLRSVF